MQSSRWSRAVDGAAEKKRPHVLVIPLSSQGHIIPAFMLSKALVRQGLRVTFVSHKPEIDRLLSDEESGLKSMELLHFVRLPRPNVFTASPRDAVILLEKSFKAANMLGQLSLSGGPTCIVSDMFIYWATELALQLRIPRFTFLPCGAVTARFLQAMEDLFNRGALRKNAHDSRLEMFDGQVSIEGLPALRYHELFVSCRVVPIPFKASAKNIMAASGILINTFYELEASVIDKLRNLSPITGQKFYPIGPLLQSSSSVAIVQGLEDSKEQCIRWLDSQPESSVLYISFGVSFRLKPLQIEELALGLERSKHRFLWVLHHPTVISLNDMGALDAENSAPAIVPGSDVLPPGFEARVAGRGYIVKGWAPQVHVLSHPATAGFLTHCGWNSCLEAVSTGVRMLAWPISADQHVNYKYLMEELKVAFAVRKGPDGIANQEEVERAVRLFMEGERMAMRGKMDVLKRKAAAALAVGGSSTYAVQQFAQDIKNL